MKLALRILVGIGAISIAAYTSTFVGQQFADHIKSSFDQGSAATIMAFGAAFVLVFVPLVFIGNSILNFCFKPQTTKELGRE